MIAHDSHSLYGFPVMVYQCVTSRNGDKREHER